MDAKLKKVLNLQPHFNIADSIPLRSISDDGVMEIKEGLYSKTYRVQDINFGVAKLAERGGIVQKWAALLKAVDPAYDLQICVYNHTVDVEYLGDAVLLQETGDGLDALREDINKVVRRNISSGNNGIRRDIYLTLTIPGVDMTAANRSFIAAEHDLLTILRSIPGCAATPLKAMQRLNLMHDIYSGGEETELEEYGMFNRERIRVFSLDELYKSGVTATELIMPGSMEFRNDHFILGGKYGRTLSLKRLSAMASDSISRELTSMPFPMMFTTNLHQMDAMVAHNLVKAQRRNSAGALAEKQKEASQKGYSPDLANPELRKNIEEMDRLLEDLEGRDQKLFETKMHIVIWADSKEQLDERCNVFVTKCRTMDVIFEAQNGLQENTLISAMPFGIDSTPRHRTLTTEALSVFVPFASQEMTQKGGTVYGVNKITKNIITYNRLLGDSYNGLILGFTGSGKSFFAKKEILNTYLNRGNDADVIIIDPQAEYGKLCEATHGVEIIIKGAGEHHINPLDISAAYGRNPIADKVSFVHSVVAEMLEYPPNAVQKTAINIAAKRSYDAWRESPVEENIPTLEDFYNKLVEYYNSDGGQLADILDVIKAVEYYVMGTETLFQGMSNVNTDASFISYNIAELGDGVRPLAMLVILDSILNRMSRNRAAGRATFVYIDEIHLLFRNAETAAWIKSLWKTARKYRCAPLGITQDVEDLLSTDSGRSLITNSAFVVLLKQQAINASVLAEQLQLSDRQLEFVTDSPAGEGLLCIQNATKYTGGVIPFEDHYPEESLLYKICQTTDMRQEA